MRFVAVVSCVHVALSSAEKAVGVEPQYLFAADTIGMWWLMVAFWAAAAAIIFYRGAP